MTTIDSLEEAEAPFVGSKVTETEPPRSSRFGDLWWRYLVSLIAIAFSLFPVAVRDLGRVQPRALAEHGVADPRQLHARELP